MNIITHEQEGNVMQKGLKQRIIEALQIDDLPAVDTPSDAAIGKDMHV